MNEKSDPDVRPDSLIQNSIKFQKLKKKLRVATKLSLTGITNLVVNYEDPMLVNCFLQDCFKNEELYRETLHIDAVELQKGQPGVGLASSELDIMIFGNFKLQDKKTPMSPDVYVLNQQTGHREREVDGFVNRKEVLTGKAKDKLLIIRNLDYCLDFCPMVTELTPAGTIDSRALWLFDNFRNPKVKKSCRLLLVSNTKLKFPFKVRVIDFEPLDEFDANHLINSFTNLYTDQGYDVDFKESQKKQLVRKLCGLTYTEAGDALSEAMSMSGIKGSGKYLKKIHVNKVVKYLREKINKNLMEDAVGLTHLTPRPWEDYILSASSNFSYDVKKITRDFNEIDKLKIEKANIIKDNGDPDLIEKEMDAIRSRIPHVIVLHGRGGVGKSAFPIHLAGLLDFDAWDFNAGASHSKFVGEGGERMRGALKRISKASHVVVRIDEYDRAMGATGASGDGMHVAHKQVESEFMNWLQNEQEDNSFVKNNIFIVLTTNHKDNITGPLLRSGRADLVMDIGEFDSGSMKETFLSAPRRMEHRGVVTVGYNYKELLEAIQSLDLDQIVDIASQKGFTVRDVDVLLQELAAHHYYYQKNEEGFEWNTQNFLKVLENSIGSASTEETCELSLGDRYLMENKS